VGFEPTITESERAKTVHALDRAATVTGRTTVPVITSQKTQYNGCKLRRNRGKLQQNSGQDATLNLSNGHSQCVRCCPE
jgi:hypothetical protein